MQRYNGHLNWDYWNVSLWINNGEPLYRLARVCMTAHKTATNAAEAFLGVCGSEKTPDGAIYTMPNVRAAIKDILS
jgi:hypothetical protein